MNNLNNFATHPLQSLEWGEFRKKTGVKVIEGSSFLLTIHKIPHTNFKIGYLPKVRMPDKAMIEELKKIGKAENCVFIQLEPNIPYDEKLKNDIEKLDLRKSVHPLFTRFTFILDLTKSEEELLKKMHPKTRYNIKVAQKHGVRIIEEDSEKAFGEYLKLTEETTKRQGFFAHTRNYHTLMWKTLKRKSGEIDKDKLSACLLVARYKTRILATWVLFIFKDTLYYPFGASSNEYREVMASNLIMWEAIKFGKKLGLKKFDMWGSLGPNPNKSDQWYGFHRFKEGYGAELVEYLGSYDLVIKKSIYMLFPAADKLRWFLLRIRRKF